jgi:4-carboxymuconolactone decarboxylase
MSSTDPGFEDLHKQLFDAGLKVRRSVVGEAYVDRALSNGSTEFSRPGQELVTEWCWGYAWTRPGLDRKQRSLLNIGMLMALNRAPELGAHIRGARNNGLTELEIREAILHCKHTPLRRRVTPITYLDTVDGHQMANIVDRHNILRCACWSGCHEDGRESP